uniref:F-box/LRR-repeat protein At5g41840 n=1 Tax=Nicotiana sylvestris TaxID=4096 RepID=A0A1U7YP77_NICSY|nr:PREDICTED: putative F-box/LRR-repeat protein At5g41840 [Nicotiana sylvestris]
MARANATNPNGRKQIRTIFSQYQKKKMLEFAERVGWKLQKRDDELISDFCSKIGVKKRLLKVWMHDNENTFATADILPNYLIHEILSCLNIKESTKMSILSKTWLQAWSTLPNLKFICKYSIDSKIIDAILERYRVNKIPIDKFEFSYCLEYRSRDVFPLIDKWLGIALQNGVKHLLYNGNCTLNPSIYKRTYTLIPSYPLPIYTILASEALRELVLTDFDLMSVSLSDGVASCHSLRMLSLSRVSLDENMLQTLLNSCPLLVALILEYCPGLKKIELLNLQKIKSASIRAKINQRVKVKAPTLEHVSESLEVLYIRDCEGIWEIDAPNLVSLDYNGDQAPELKIAKEPRQLKHSKIILHCSSSLNAISVTICCIFCSGYLIILLVVTVSFSSFLEQRVYRNLSLYLHKNPSLSICHGSKAWRCQLKEVKAYKFDSKNQPVELRSGQLAIRSLTGS